MTSSQQQPSSQNSLLQHMAAINRLNIKAFSAKKKESLIFIILNDTIHAIRYDRAVLWDMEGKKPKILGVSGQHEVNKDARLTKHWEAMAAGIIDPKKSQIITVDSLGSGSKDWQEYQEQKSASVIWIPIMHENELVLGLWLELFDGIKNEATLDDTLKFLGNFLTPAYASAWIKFRPKFHLKDVKLEKSQISIFLAGILLFLLIVRIPLRVIAPCEVVAQDPFFITAPLEGTIEEVVVEPGEFVNKDQTLYEYDKRVALRNLRVAEKEKEILEAEVARANTLGLQDKRSRAELRLLQLKLEKEKVNLNLAKWQASQLTQNAPVSGIVMLDNPDAWRGKSVQVGQRIMTINDPEETKLRIWIPESDNVVLNPDTPIKVILNISPQTSHFAKLNYIANESVLNPQRAPSFVAEANWIKQPEGIKLGLKGTAILYGENVSLFYFLIRKPWSTLRNTLGI